MSGLLVAGTTSDAGKSVVTTGLCRAFARRGVRVAPYKAQNMSNNSMVCPGPDGRMAEIGRAQWAQALAARAAPEPAMNPVLLKPGTDRRSHVVLMGQPAGDVSSADWQAGRRHLAAAAHTAFDDLAGRFDVIVAEGAGSPAEINLRSSDFVNMGLARHAGLPAVVVGDIDRGGVLAAMYGTVALLEPDDQALIAGFIVNKFRGDPALLSPGLDALEKLTGRRVYGVLPWDPRQWLDSEDALDLEGRRARGAAAYRVDSVLEKGRSETPRLMKDVTGRWSAPAPRTLARGSYVVRAAQPFGLLAFYLLEPESEDGLAQWSFYDGVLVPHADFPIVRIEAPAAIPSHIVRD